MVELAGVSLIIGAVAIASFVAGVALGLSDGDEKLRKLRAESEWLAEEANAKIRRLEREVDIWKDGIGKTEKRCRRAILEEIQGLLNDGPHAEEVS